MIRSDYKHSVASVRSGVIRAQIVEMDQIGKQILRGINTHAYWIRPPRKALDVEDPVLRASSFGVQENNLIKTATIQMHASRQPLKTNASRIAYSINGRNLVRSMDGQLLAQTAKSTMTP